MVWEGKQWMPFSGRCGSAEIHTVRQRHYMPKIYVSAEINEMRWQEERIALTT